MNRRQFLETSMLATAGLLQPLSSISCGTSRPLERKGAAKRVIVVGAGLAGLSAAYELRGAGHDVTILEAQRRPGGRVLTLREPFSDGLYAELGATDIPDSHHLTLHYARQFNLTLKTSPPPARPLRSLYVLRGQRLEIEPDVEPDYPYGLTPEEKKLGWSGMWRKYILPAVQEIGDPSAPDWKVPRKYDQITYSEFLRSQGASPEAAELLGLGVSRWGDGPETVSAIAPLRDVISEVESEAWFRIAGGSDLLPRAFASRLAEVIRYGSPVVRIEHDSGGVTVVVRSAGAQQVLAGDYLVCAIPFSVLKHIEVSPPFSDGKRKAIDELPYFSAARLSLQVRRRFWLDEDFDGNVWGDLPVGNISHVTKSQPGPRGILQTYSGGPDARMICSFSEEDRIRFALEEIEKVFPRTREYFEGGVSKCWDEDPWARGASSWYRPGQMSELWPHVARPEGRVHFAGDHTSPWIRWMQGALHSGHRVARDIIEAARKDVVDGGIVSTRTRSA